MDRLQAVPDLQSAWLLLSYCAAPRANHILRLLPPATSSDYAEGHDEDVWTALNGLLSQHERVIDKGGPAAPTAIAAARSTNQPVASEARTRSLATLPGSFGGLGLRAASRAAAGAYWAAWVDALPVLAARAPDRTAQILSALEGSGAASACTEAANFCRDFLVAQGMEGVPSWAEAVAGARPGTNRDELPREPGEWPHGWQFFACRASETYYLRRTLEPTLSPQHLTKLGLQSGRFVSRAVHLAHCQPAQACGRGRPASSCHCGAGYGYHCLSFRCVVQEPRAGKSSTPRATTSRRVRILAS